MNPSKYFKKTWKKNDDIESNTAILPLVPYEKKKQKKTSDSLPVWGISSTYTDI